MKMKNKLPLLLAILIMACTKSKTLPVNSTSYQSVGINKITFTNCQYSNAVINGSWDSLCIGTVNQGMNNATHLQIIFSKDSLYPNLSINTRLSWIGIDSLNNSVFEAYLGLPISYTCAPIGNSKVVLYSSQSIKGNTITITKFGVIGSLIEGTYNLKLAQMSGTDTIKLTGQFSVTRKL